MEKEEVEPKGVEPILLSENGPYASILQKDERLVHKTRVEIRN